MSHFTVLIIGDNIEKQLAPYQENNMSDCPEEYLEFHDKEDELLDAYNTDTTKKVMLESGEIVDYYDERFKVKVGTFETKIVVPDHLKLIDMPMKEAYPTFEEYALEYEGYKHRDQTHNRYGYWENPQAKWDWYQIGGRWTGFFKLKESETPIDHMIGEPGIMTEAAKEGYADSVEKKYIDFEFMRKIYSEKAAKRWDEVHEIVGDAFQDLKTWDMVRDIECAGDLDKAKKVYNNQEAAKRFSKLEFGFWSKVEDYNMPRSTYIQNATDEAITTFAVVKDGQWYEKGSMGWWGCVSDEKEQHNWNREFSKLLDECPDDTLLTIVDCHI